MVAMLLLIYMLVYSYEKQRQCSHDEYEKHDVAGSGVIVFTCNNCALLLIKAVREHDGDNDGVVIAIPEFLRAWSEPVIAKHWNDDNTQYCYRFSYRKSMLAPADTQEVWEQDADFERIMFSGAADTNDLTAAASSQPSCESSISM